MIFCHIPHHTLIHIHMPSYTYICTVLQWKNSQELLRTSLEIQQHSTALDEWNMSNWAEIRCSHLHESPNPKDPLGVVITQHHWAEDFLEEVNGQGRKTLWVNGHVFVTKASDTVIVDFGCGQYKQSVKGWAPSGWTLPLKRYDDEHQTKPNRPRLRFDLKKLRGPDVACTFRATIGGKFAPLIGLSDEDRDIDTMITTYNKQWLMQPVRSLGRNAARKSHGSPKMFSTSVMRGEIWRRSGMKQKEQKIQGNKQEDSEGSE